MKKQGIVKWYHDAKGFGFIETYDGEEVFVHYTSIIGSGRPFLLEGQKVECELKEGKKGYLATKVIPLSKEMSH